MFDFENNKEYRDILNIFLEEYSKNKKGKPNAEQYKYEILINLNRELKVEDIKNESIQQIIEILRKNNPQQGSFVHWSNIDDLARFTKEEPELVTRLLVNLFDKKQKPSRRINSFKEAAKKVDSNFRLGTPLFGYIMAAFDVENYVIYKDSSFKNFARWFDVDVPDDIGSKYELYLDVCNKLKNYMSENFKRDFVLLDAQDLIFSTSEYIPLKFKIYIRYLFKLSRRFKSYLEDTVKFLEDIKSLDEKYLQREKDYYSNKEKIGRIRYEILNGILENPETFSIDEIETIKERINSLYDTNILQSWDNFKILFQIYYDLYKEKIRYFMNDIHKILKTREGLKDLNFKEGKIVIDFSGSQQFGTYTWWMGLYPANKQTHKDSAMLFLGLDEKLRINYGLALGDNIRDKYQEDFEVEEDINNLTLGRIVSKFKDVIDKYKEINQQELNVIPEVSEKNDSIKLKDPLGTKGLDFNQDLKIDKLYFKDLNRIKAQIKGALSSGKNLVLVGPPGTGKSKLAKEVCKSFGVKYKMVTANSDWSTFDTIGGYRPEKDGSLYFSSGIFLDCFKDQKSGRAKNQWLIIDEINRADIDKAFGSLFSVLTGDRITLSFKADNGKNIVVRPQEESENLQPLDYEYIMPKDWRLIATMNTFDKTSLYEMSYAFMRRFAFIPVPVPEKITGSDLINYLKCWGIEDQSFVENVRVLWEKINKYRKIGPAIVEDIYNHLIVSDGDFVSAVVMYVLPQFEGMVEDKLVKFIQELCELDFIKEDSKDIYSFSNDYFGLEERFDEN